MFLSKAAAFAGTAALSFLPYAVPAMTVAVGAHGFYKFGKYITEGVELARKVVEKKPVDLVRKVKKGKVRKNKKKRRAGLPKKVFVTRKKRESPLMQIAEVQASPASHRSDNLVT